MGFSIRKELQNGLDQTILQDELTGTEIAVLPSHGATLHKFSIRHQGNKTASEGHSGETFNIIDNYRDLTELQQDMNRSFKGPKLSPFPCRIAGATYQFEGKEYTFRNSFGDGTAIHGLLYNKAFAITHEEAGEISASSTMEYIYRQDDPAYPHHYSCQAIYTLHPGNLLEVTTRLTNLGTDTLPIADGWHPYFQLGGKVDDWQLQFHARAIVEFDQQLIPTGHVLPYDHFNQPRLIGGTQLDNCFLLQEDSLHPACTLVNPATGHHLALYPDRNYPYLQIYTPPSRRSIAIENLSSAPDSFNNKMGLLLLLPGHSQTFTVKYQTGFA